MPTLIEMTIYQCDQCGETYDTLELAESCEEAHEIFNKFTIIGHNSIAAKGFPTEITVIKRDGIGVQIGVKYLLDPAILQRK